MPDGIHSRLLGSSTYRTPIVACFLARLPRTTSDPTRTVWTYPAWQTMFDLTLSISTDIYLMVAHSARSVVIRGRSKVILGKTAGIPLVLVEHHSRGQIGLKVSKTTARSTYTDLSHVWSGGFGNPSLPRANILPQCQA